MLGFDEIILQTYESSLENYFRLCVNYKTALLQSDEQVIISAKTSERRKESKENSAFVQILDYDEKIWKCMKIFR